MRQMSVTADTRRPTAHGMTFSACATAKRATGAGTGDSDCATCERLVRDPKNDLAAGRAAALQAERSFFQAVSREARDGSPVPARPWRWEPVAEALLPSPCGFTIGFGETGAVMLAEFIFDRVSIASPG